MRAALLLLLAATALPAQPDRFGLPACQGPSRELAIKSAFILCHDSASKTPAWTVYELTAEQLAAPSAKPKRFRRDWTLTQPGASDLDYRNSSYARGHMVPARDMSWSEDSSRDSFLLSNAVPQDPSMNRSIWLRVENEIRRRAHTADSVIVLTGPVFCPDSPRIGPNEVAVPCEIFKAALEIRAHQTSVFAVMIPNSPGPHGPISAYVTTLDALRARTGLDLLPLLE